MLLIKTKKGKRKTQLIATQKIEEEVEKLTHE